MKPRLTVLTLAVDDLERAVHFYRDGLGLPTQGIIGAEFEHGAVAFFDLQHGLKLALWPRNSLAHDTGLARGTPSSTECSLGHNVASKQDVDAVMEQARQAGARIVKPAAIPSGAVTPAISPIRTATCGKWCGIPSSISPISSRFRYLGAHDLGTDSMNDYLGLLAGVVAAGIGGELFVRGAVGLAHWARISPGIIGATVAAFATSSPELSVSVNSALDGTPEIALGDALGSNVVNVALVLALALVIAGIQSPRDSIKRDFPVALLVPVITGVLFLDGVLSRVDGVLLLALFAAWLTAAVVEARRQRSAAEAVLGTPRVGAALAFGVVGLGFLVLAGNFIVVAAKGIAATYGIDEFIIGRHWSPSARPRRNSRPPSSPNCAATMK